MKTVTLPTGEIVMYDDCDHETVSRFNWRRTSSPRPYAIANVPGTQTCMLMHRLILGAKKGMHVDHKDGNGCDNRRSNLREGTRSQNHRGFRQKPKGTSSLYRGVSKHGKSPGWTASISIRSGGQRKTHYIGYFKTQEDAALAYNQKAKELGFFPEALNRVA